MSGFSVVISSKNSLFDSSGHTTHDQVINQTAKIQTKVQNSLALEILNLEKINLEHIYIDLV